MAPKGVSVLIPESCDYMTLWGKKGFADIIRLRTSRQVILDYPGGPSISTGGVCGRETGRPKKEMWGGRKLEP